MLRAEEEPMTTARMRCALSIKARTSTDSLASYRESQKNKSRINLSEEVTTKEEKTLE